MPATPSSPNTLSTPALPDNIDLSDPASIMHAVLALASAGENSTQPNPQVGCVLVKDGVVVGQGFHQRAGELHAERLALQQAGDEARGATAYLNLEPCCHQGRTPPCTDALIDAGVVKVVCAMGDPNPLVAGGGFELLRSAGIEVTSGVAEDKAIWMNRGFVSRMKRKLPWLIVKSAATLDGRTAAHDGQSKWITGPEARAQVHNLRARCSAILTGIDTVLADDPQLTARIDASSEVALDQRQPLRVVLDSSLKIPLDAKIINPVGTSSTANLVIFTCSDDFEKIAALTEMGVEVISLPANPAGRLPLQQVLSELAQWQCNEVLVEAGQTLCGAFVQAGLVDELHLFYAGSILGDKGKPMFGFESPIEFSKRVHFEIKSVDQVGKDFVVKAVNAQSFEELSPSASL